MKFHESSPYFYVALASIMVLTVLLGAGFWLLFNDSVFDSQAIVSPETSPIVVVSPQAL